MTIELILGDCLEIMKSMPENSVDTIITDPPYELGFMGKAWDSSGVAFQKETWEEALRVAKPGAIMLAFGGTRTYHRLVCAIEDAGWEIRDTIMWIYGSGFPKSHNISKAIDKNAGAEREVWNEKRNSGGLVKGQAYEGGFTQESGLKACSAPSTPEAQLWDGWGTALKPAVEPICVAMKPIDGTFAQNALKWGVAGLWIDGGRVETEEDFSRGGTRERVRGYVGIKSEEMIPAQPASPLGRFPANVIHDGSDEVVGLFPNGHARGNKSPTSAGGGMYGHGKFIDENPFEGDSGSAARFFKTCEQDKPQGRFPANLIHDGSDEVVELFPAQKSGARKAQGYQPDAHLWNKMGGKDCEASEGSASRFFYCAKASRSERNAGLEGMETVTTGNTLNDGWVKRDDRAGANRHGAVNIQNFHPTVKPLALMEYLVRLTSTPTGGVVLDPFMGSGTTGCACITQGRDFIGIEQNEEYIEIAEKRIHDAQMQPRLEYES